MGKEQVRQSASSTKEARTLCERGIDSHGLHKSPEKVEAVLKAPHPCNEAEGRSFLGLVNYYKDSCRACQQWYTL